MKILTACCLLFYLSTPAYSQDFLIGKVLDKETNQPIPYVNIGIRAKGIGTVSSFNGEFKLRLTSPSDTVLFSSIGYKTEEYLVKSIQQNNTVQLSPETAFLEEVIINANRYPEQIILGEKLNRKGHSVGFGSRQLGTEIGAHIKVKKETLLESAHFTLNFTGGDSLLFRVKIYSFKGGKPGPNLIKENIILSAPQQKGTVSVDLSKYNISVSQDVLLALEWIMDDQGKGNTGIMFRSKKSLTSNLWAKQTSFGRFRNLSKLIPNSPKLDIGFYLIGKQEN